MKNRIANSHVAWVDWIRVIACFLVVLAHCCDPFVAKFDSNYGEFLSGVAIGSFVRPCVPLFVMISGVLLLPIQQDMSTFYRRRLSRILWPLAIWSLISPILFYLYLTVGEVETANVGIALSEHSLPGTLNKLWSWIINFNYTTIPLWYLYMLVGLYLFMPIISAWLTQARKRDIQVFLAIWLFALCIPYITMGAPVVGYGGNYGSMDIFGGSFWNPYGTFYYFSGFLGYVVLAYYLKTYPLNWSKRKTLAITIPMFLVGYATTFGGFVLTQRYFPGSFEALEVIWYFSSINVFLMTFAMYLWVLTFATRTTPLLSKVASLTFGVYLAHWFIVQLSYDALYDILPFAAALKIITLGIVAFSSTLFIVWLISKLPFRKYLIG